MVLAINLSFWLPIPACCCIYVGFLDTTISIVCSISPISKELIALLQFFNQGHCGCQHTAPKSKPSSVGSICVHTEVTMWPETWQGVGRGSHRKNPFAIINNHEDCKALIWRQNALHTLRVGEHNWSTTCIFCPPLIYLESVVRFSCVLSKNCSHN